METIKIVDTFFERFRKYLLMSSFFDFETIVRERYFIVSVIAVLCTFKTTDKYNENS